MTTYNVRLNREIQLVFEGIEADSFEEAAAIACDKRPAAADDIDSCDGETFAAQVEVAGDEDIGQSVTIDFEGERRHKTSSGMVAALRWITRCPSIRGPAGTTAYVVSDERMAEARAAVADAEMLSPSAGHAAGAKPYSVLLLYPDYLSDQYGTETYYAFVTAADSVAAIDVAQRKAAAAHDVEIDDPADFAPLLVIEGHHYGQSMSNP